MDVTADKGWVADNFTGTDHPYDAPKGLKSLSSVNLHKDPNYNIFLDEPFDQGQLGSCVANATATCYRFEVQRHIALDKIKELHAIQPSRLFIYYNARASEYKKIRDTGCQTRFAFKSLDKKGVCEEITWPYVMLRPKEENETNEAYAKYMAQHEPPAHEQPRKEAYTQALGHKIKEYLRLDVDREAVPHSLEVMEKDGKHILDNLRLCLTDGHPVVFGFGWNKKGPSPWMDPGPDGFRRIGKLQKARHAPIQNRSGHAILAVGYDDSQEAVLCQNSWGKGEYDPFWIPYEWITDFTATNDFWTMRVVGK